MSQTRLSNTPMAHIESLPINVSVVSQMIKQEVTLTGPSEELRSALLAMAEEYQAAGDDRYKSAIKDFSAFMHDLELYAQGLDLPPGWVQATTFWLVCDNHIIGRSTLRHHLTPELEREGGHIGYDIRPSERRKGYGTLILKLTLEKAMSLGLSRVLVTCDADNLASARIIEKNGGKLQGQVISDRSGKVVSQYWIEL